MTWGSNPGPDEQEVYKPAPPEDADANWWVDVGVIVLATVGAFALCNWLVEVLS